MTQLLKIFNAKALTFSIACLAAVITFGLGFQLGVEHMRLQFEIFKKEQAQQALRQINEEREKYDEKIKALDADLSAARGLAAERLRQLERWRDSHGSGNAAACDAGSALRLAVEAEGLLYEADGYLRALMQ